MRDQELEEQIERKARRRAVFSGVVTSTIISCLIASELVFTKAGERTDPPFFKCLSLFVFYSPMGGLAGSIGDKTRQTISGAAISASVFLAYGLIFASAFTWNSIVPEWFIPVFSCASAVIGALCGGIGVMFGRTCREFEGKRFWPQFSIAELMAFVFLVAALMSCLVTLRQILGKPS
jgi:hypothetical protein